MFYTRFATLEGFDFGLKFTLVCLYPCSFSNAPSAPSGFLTLVVSLIRLGFRELAPWLNPIALVKSELHILRAVFKMLTQRMFS